MASKNTGRASAPLLKVSDAPGLDPLNRPASAPVVAEKEPETEDVAQGGAHRLSAPVAPAPKVDADVTALRHLRGALEQAGYRNHAQALEAGLEAAEQVPAQRASREVQAYKAEVLDYLRGKIKQRDERAA